MVLSLIHILSLKVTNQARSGKIVLVNSIGEGVSEGDFTLEYPAPVVSQAGMPSEVEMGNNLLLSGSSMNVDVYKRQGVRFYVSGSNLLYIWGSGYKGINPESRMTSGNYSSAMISGYQRGGFPLTSTISAGFDINF